MFYPPNRLPRSVAILLGIMLAGFVMTAAAPDMVIGLFGLTPKKTLHDLWLWQPFTYMALHGGLLHLFFNMFALYMFGTALSLLWGEQKFLLYFVICGLGAAALTVALTPRGEVPTIGASGAIYGLLYAWAREFPDSIVYVWGFIPVRAKHLVAILFIVEFALSQVPSPIARFAHLGGLLTGFLYCNLPAYLTGWEWRIKERAAPKAKRRAQVRQGAASSLEDVDKILEKIITQGIDNLTPQEKQILEAASRKFKQGKTE